MAALRIQSVYLGASTLQWCSLEWQGTALSQAQVFALWCSDVEFCRAWVQALRGVAYPAYCWECPPVDSRDLHRPFECVFVASPRLAQSKADPQPFLEHFTADVPVVSFASLGGDAWLIAPCPAAHTDCTHLASFIATASEDTAVALWRAVAEALQRRIAATPLWLSTAGLGVSWLHVRLDSRPKYYRHGPYRALKV